MRVWRIGETGDDRERVLNYVAKGLEVSLDRCECPGSLFAAPTSRISLQEIGDDREDMQPAEYDRRRDEEVAPRLRQDGRSRRLGKPHHARP